MNEIIEHDGFLAHRYEGHELSHGDTVWFAVPGLPDVGEWAEVDEDGDVNEPVVAVRPWWVEYPIPVRRELIKFVRLHSCECGAVGPDSWRICHPEA